MSFEFRSLGRRCGALFGELNNQQVYVYRWPQCGLTVDIVLFSNNRQVLLIERAADPCKGSWAFPGGFVEIAEDEQVFDAALRELKEETGIDAKDQNMVQVGAYAGPKRDSRGYSCTFAYAAIVDPTKVFPKAGDDAKNVGWFDLGKLPDLAFDHAEILKDACRIMGISPQ